MPWLFSLFDKREKQQTYKAVNRVVSVQGANKDSTQLCVSSCSCKHKQTQMCIHSGSLNAAIEWKECPAWRSCIPPPPCRQTNWHTNRCCSLSCRQTNQHTNKGCSRLVSVSSAGEQRWHPVCCSCVSPSPPYAGPLAPWCVVPQRSSVTPLPPQP